MKLVTKIRASRISYFLGLFGLLGSNRLSAEVHMPAFFSDGMVLQRETGAAIWGWADPGVEANVTFGGQTESAKTDARGTWTVVLKDLPASKVPQDLLIEVEGRIKKIRDVVVGEVWLASGQSNMVWPMSKSSTREVAKSVQKPLIRHYRGEFVASDQLQSDFEGRWLKADPTHTPDFSGVAFHFSEKLYQELDVPIGILQLAWGGQRIQSFIRPGAIKHLPAVARQLQVRDRKVQQYDPMQAEADYQQKRAAYEQELAEWEASGERRGRPREPGRYNPKTNPGFPGHIYQGMIHPFVGYGLRGVLWYQGENNRGDAQDYGMFLETLVEDWRSLWGSQLSFYWVQLADCVDKNEGPGYTDPWVDVQEQQRLALSRIQRGGMVVANDIGGSLHPGNKQDVGYRLARWALNRDYGHTDIVVSGPLFKSADFTDHEVRIEFEYAEGLRTRDGSALTGFDVMLVDGTWEWGVADFVDGAVWVRSPSSGRMQTVRYAWHKKPDDANLVNAAGLPASCFSVKRN